MTVDQLSRIQALAAGIADLSKTFKGSSELFIVDSLPFLKKSEELIGLEQPLAEHVTSLIVRTMETAVIRTLLSLNVLQTIPTTGSISLQSLAVVTETHASLLERLLRVVIRAGFLIRENSAYRHTHTCFGLCWTDWGTFRALLRRRNSALDQTARVSHLRPSTGFFGYAKLVSEDRGRPVFVDVGGGNGHVSKEVLQGFPQMRPEQCVLEDRAETLELARMTGLLPAGVQLLEHDYLTRQPISNAKAYHLRAVAYNLGDAELVQLLKQMVPVMGPESKVLIAETILSDDNGAAFSTVSDMNMLCIGGKEGTERNFREVLHQASLTIDSIHRAPGLECGIVEASLKMP
ncbi:S-adenosyl-L-methionine-dependent methyltransferase [Xylariales sp. AK1849]|nr:S-adenosyl-L-methionine-dependent methyltransferase [Xylariales sp. AK1849]